MLVAAIICIVMSSAGAFRPCLLGKTRRWTHVADRKANRVDKILDDFMGKKFGAGEYFYGERSSGVKNDTILQTQKYAPLTPNAILVVGRPDCEWLQCTIIELIEKGFAVRLLCPSAFAAYQATSLTGVSFDVVEVSSEQSLDDIALAVRGGQAIILGSMNKRTILQLPFLKAPPIQEQVLEAIKHSRSTGEVDVKRIILLSTDLRDDARLLSQVVMSGIDYVVVHPAGGISHRGDSGRAEHLSVQAVDLGASVSFSGKKLSAPDVAEAVVQALLQPSLVNVTCVVAPEPAPDRDATTALRGTSTASILASDMVRPPRPAFYRTDRGGAAGAVESMRGNGVTVEMVMREAALRRLGVLQAVRDPNEVRRQLLEDEEVERSWEAMFLSVMTE